MQREVITSALEGHDVFLQAATSFGKSLCFQLPAIIDYRITIVVSPLLALMNNQIAALRAASIQVATINSQTSPSVKHAILEDLKSGHPRTRLLYVTPEYCALDYFRKLLKLVYEQRELARVAVDEAHCISEWQVIFCICNTPAATPFAFDRLRHGLLRIWLTILAFVQGT